MLDFNLKEKLKDRSDQAEPHGLPWILIVLLLVLLSLAVLYFGQSVNYQTTAASGTHSTLRPPRTYSVFYNGGVFSPTNLHIHSGDTVKFQNNSLTSIRIVPNTERDQENGVGLANIGEVQPKNSFSYIFSLAGIFNYHNEKNPNEAGAIIIR